MSSQLELNGLVLMFVIVEFIGTLQSLMGTKKCTLKLEEGATVSTLTRRLKTAFSIGEEFDRANMLILVNKKEISTLKGLQTELGNNDIITLISVTHGG